MPNTIKKLKVSDRFTLLLKKCHSQGMARFYTIIEEHDIPTETRTHKSEKEGLQYLSDVETGKINLQIELKD